MDEIQPAANIKDQVFTIKTIDIENTPKIDIQVLASTPIIVEETYTLAFIDSQVKIYDSQINEAQNSKSIWLERRGKVLEEVNKVKP